MAAPTKTRRRYILHFAHEHLEFRLPVSDYLLYVKTKLDNCIGNTALRWVRY